MDHVLTSGSRFVASSWSFSSNPTGSISVDKREELSSPELLLTSGGQVTVDKAEGRSIEHEGHSHRSLVPCDTHMAVETDGVCPPKRRVVVRPVEKWKCLPRVLAIPVFTLSEKTWEILFSCSGFTRTIIRMFHRL